MHHNTKKTECVPLPDTNEHPQIDKIKYIFKRFPFDLHVALVSVNGLKC